MRDKKKTIVIGNWCCRDLVKKQKELVDILKKHGIKFREAKQRIITDKIIIKFIHIRFFSQFNKNIYGIRADGCYGFDDEVTNYITKGNNICKGHDIMEFIL